MKDEELPSLKNMDFFSQSFLVVIKIANLIYYILIKGKLKLSTEKTIFKFFCKFL